MTEASLNYLPEILKVGEYKARIFKPIVLTKYKYCGETGHKHFDKSCAALAPPEMADHVIAIRGGRNPLSNLHICPAGIQFFRADVSIQKVEKTLLLGDFNSVTDSCDRLSGQLDGTSTILHDFLSENGLHEPLGLYKNSFSYFHPSLSNRKSHLDCIYVNFPANALWGYCSHMPCSDHYLVGLCSITDSTKGPSQRHFSPDLLSNLCFVQQVHLILDCFSVSGDNLAAVWEGFKLKIHSLSQQYMQFHQKQASAELSSLCASLRYVNNRIFAGDNLENDWLRLQDLIQQNKDRAFFLRDETSDWAHIEGKQNKQFLHLEDLMQQNNDIKLLVWAGREHHDVDSILQILRDFYSDLYSEDKLTATKNEIETFLDSLQLLPSLKGDLSMFTMFTEPISSKEVENDIKLLQT